eukprot:CAMPEP_0173157800 /NCGR_PEP_ID=MMETSP1105-20130129/15876_1 /TAXON_ID=2985 /ORGANISM="Ochromonas sp., Strain BG-1" /LENGTH=176 /DNA_ID=CAMNT_0014075405 /DNA_START=56 /DNA_END=586 /DNA_ORIENTATION=-
MPAYHSKKNEESFQEACGCAICPLRTDVKGPAPPSPGDAEDIIDEVLLYFRANVLFRNFEVRGAADRTLIYLTMHAVQCLVKCERIEDKPSAIRELRALSQKQFAAPGESGWPLGGLFASPANKSESDLFKSFFKQAREELALRLCERLFDADGTKNKWWQSFSKKRFMGKELKDF